MLSDKAKFLGKEQAFPFIIPSGQPEVNWGMSYRQWLVGLAMQGLLTDPAKYESSEASVAEYAVRQADAILEALAKEGT